MTPKISIVMPVYNVEKYLRECLDSVRAQTFTDWECICVDDGSSDASPAILDEYAAKDSRFKVIKREHTNAGACRNAGMDQAKGEFLQFLDSDDVFSPQMLLFLHGAIAQSAADMSSCDAVKFQTEQQIPNISYSRCAEVRTFEEPVKHIDTFRYWIGRPWDKMFRRAFIDGLNIRFQEIRSTNDEFFIDIAVASAQLVAHVGKALIAYRQHSSSLQATQQKDPSCLIAAIDAIHNEMERRGMFSDNASLFLHFRAMIARSCCQLRRMNTVDSYSTMFGELSNLCSKYHLGELSKRETGLSDSDYDWFQKLTSAKAPMEMLLAEIGQLRLEVSELRPLRNIAKSQAYKIWKIVIWLPRQAKRILHAIGNKSDFNDFSGQGVHNLKMRF